MEQLELRPFSREDFEIYKSWFADELIETALGPMDRDWLDHVLAEEPNSQFSLFIHGSLVAVVGVAFPVSDHSYFVVTDIAVAPRRRKLGIGGRVIQSLR